MTRHVPADTQLVGSGRAAHPAALLDLDTQIGQLEQRLVAREAWVRSTALSLGRRAQHAVSPKSWLLPTVGGVAVLWLGWRWWLHRTPVPPVRAALPVIAAAQGPDELAAVPWAGLVALGWPLLPAEWRARVSPAAATAAVSTGLLVLRRLVGRRVR
jgi:apolipoprotein D and lipocalin family protein